LSTGGYNNRNRHQNECGDFPGHRDLSRQIAL
jgi:hypothetical protein